MKKLSQKSLLRAALLQKRKALPAGIRRKKSRKIFSKLLKNPYYRRAGKVAFYFDITPEVETRPFLKKILKEKEVFLPRTDPRRKNLTLRKIRSLAKDLRKGAYSVMEPGSRCPEQRGSAMDLIVVPGVGFDRKGNRLGRGAGYYDRLLKRTKKVYKIGICFREQMVKKVPMTKRDVPVDRVITD